MIDLESEQNQREGWWKMTVGGRKGRWAVFLDHSDHQGFICGCYRSSPTCTCRPCNRQKVGLSSLAHSFEDLPIEPRTQPSSCHLSESAGGLCVLILELVNLEVRHRGTRSSRRCRRPPAQRLAEGVCLIFFGANRHSDICLLQLISDSLEVCLRLPTLPSTT